jgi:acetolactate synthase regulatory subunit
MNKYAVVLSSLVDDATVSIQILVESEMSVEQLTTYYKCKSITISDVEVIQL